MERATLRARHRIVTKAGKLPQMNADAEGKIICDHLCSSVAEEVYCIEQLRSWSDESSIRLGVIGHPIEHSLSPPMMNAALRECGLWHGYARFLIRPGELREALGLMREHEFVGVNVTAPHKMEALAAMDYVDESAAAIGAVNTVQFRHGKLRGWNTDAVGFSKAVREEFGIDVRGLDALILGAGGAARAIAFACDAPHLWNRREQTVEQLRERVLTADLIVNATPVGLNEGDAPLLTRAHFRRDQFVLDTIYAPARTKLLEEAAAAGARAANGLSMLLHQGAAAFELWFNRPAPLEIMRAAFRTLPGAR